MPDRMHTGLFRKREEHRQRSESQSPSKIAAVKTDCGCDCRIDTDAIPRVQSKVATNSACVSLADIFMHHRVREGS
jgi:hypothetical protein